MWPRRSRLSVESVNIITLRQFLVFPRSDRYVGQLRLARRGLVLASAALTPSGRLQLLPYEAEVKYGDKVDAEFPEPGGGLTGDAALKYTGGVLCVTTHRLVWLSPAGSPCRACGLSLACVERAAPKPRATFGSRTPRVLVTVHVSATGAVTAGPGHGQATLAFAFRGESPDELLQALQQVLARKAWAQQPLPVLAPTPGQLRSGSSPPASSGSQLRAQDVGVAGILRRQEAAQQTRGRSMDEAFTDLKALMDKAKDMLTFAERIRDSMTRESQAVDDAASAEELESCMLSLGIISPVTRKSAGALYHQQLSLQLADFLVPQVERQGGVLTMPDVYCLFNRARGSELVSPADVIKACQLWADNPNVPLCVRRFDNGVLVVQFKTRDEDKITQTLVRLANEHSDGISVVDAARLAGLPPSIAREHLLSAESAGKLCRDDAPDGLRFFDNKFMKDFGA